MLDEIELNVIAGRGGDGIVSFRRERYVPRGGPDGGDGGKGGDVVVRAEGSLRLLERLRRQKTVRGERGGNGGPRKRHGRNGAEAVIEVPPGTVVWKMNGTEGLLADLRCEGMETVVAAGGAGGRGNARLATATRRAPRIAEKGLPGEELRLRLELRLLAEVGLVGLPNAGKSSLLRAMSRARPRVGSYPFTTVEPYLGAVEVGYETFVVADIPGLIEGAHEGKGLGVNFLQHVERTHVLVQVVDTTASDPVADIQVVRRELEAFGHGLAEKRWLVALNKIDLPEGRLRVEEAAKALRRDGVEVHRISARTREGVDGLIEALAGVVRQERTATREVSSHAPVPVRPARVRAVEVVGERGGYEVRGDGPARVVELLGLDSEEARAEVMRRLRRMGVAAALRRAGARPGDRVRVGRAELEWPG